MLKKYLYIIIPAIAVAVCSFFSLSTMDKKVADWFQRPLPSTKEDPTVLMVNIDDEAVAQIGTWPFSRNVYAESVYTMKELGADSVVFDLSFIDKSETKINEAYVTEELPEYVDAGFESIDELVIDVFSYLAGNKLSNDDATDAASLILETTNQVKNVLETNISYVIESQDKELARALKYFDNSYLTLSFGENIEIPEEELEYLESAIALDNVTVANDSKIPVYESVLPAISDFMTQAKKAGFVNASPDKDGYLRRLNPIFKMGDKYYGQLVFVPLLARFGNPEVVITKKAILLKNCKISDTVTKDVKIPLSEDGSILIKYPKKSYLDYKYVSIWNIYRLSVLEKEIKQHLEALDELGFFEYFEGDSINELYANAEYLRNEIIEGNEDISFDLYMEYKNTFIESYKDFLNGEVKAQILEDFADDEESIEFIQDNFAIAEEYFNKYLEGRQKIAGKLNNAMCIIGTNATSTTDYGLNQYEEHFPNPGVHYAFANMMLAQDFVDDSPIWISILLSIIICFAYSFAAHKIKSTGKQIIVGVSSLVVSILIFFLIFVITRTYIGVVVPVTSLLVSFIATTISGFITTSHEKRFITGAFSQCLSPDVVQEIVDNPSSFKLGGQNVIMTAIFTDIQKFSGFSELLTAGQLVALLNYYLTEMSDIIMEQRGTVDKYEGDAIVAFVGAPVKTEEHAALACKAAINMKKAELRMNKEIAEIAAGEKPEDMDQELYEAFCIMVKNNRTIFTRIGLNSGEIVAGYMGSTNKKNYTMMGNNVNLASRLEGVNKQYSTGGILMSAATRKDLGDRFVVRSLDRVQVVNVTTPIRLYELLDTAESATEELKQYVADWEKTMKVFEAGDYTAALEQFKALSARRDDDKVAKYYISLIEKFFIKGTYPTENDDFGVAFNAENPEGMNPEWVGTENEIKGTFKLLQK